MAIILVTGANQGIGYGLIQRLGKETTGNTLLLGARSNEKAAAAIKNLAKEGVKAEYVPIDVTDDVSIQKAAEIIDKKYGKLDVLVNNVGAFSLGKPTLREEMHAVIDINAASIPMILEAFKALLLKSDIKKVINMTSTMGSLDHISQTSYNQFPFSAVLSYTVSKAALNMATLSYANHWAEHNVKFLLTCPGYVNTNMTKDDGAKSIYEGTESAFVGITTDDWKSGDYVRKEPGQEVLTKIPW